MAKINRFMAEYKDHMTTLPNTTKSSAPPKIVMRRFIRLFKEVDDARIQGMIDYPLSEILVIAFLAVLSGANTWIDISDFGDGYIRFLKKFLKLKNGIPSHDTFRRVFSLIDTDQLQQATVAFLMENITSIKKVLGIKDDGLRQICIDGKEQRGTGRKYNYDEKIRNLQTLHIYDASNEICLFSKAIAEKTNEIPVAQEVLKDMNLKGSVVTFDALHTQKETIRIIAEKKGDYVGGLKGNQGILKSEAENAFTQEVLDSIKDTDAYYETSEKAHGQIEVRRYYMTKAKHRFNGYVEWQNLRNFVCYQKYTCNVIDGKEKTETRYYITSLREVILCAEAIRGHWSIENTLHWHLDYSFNEDMNSTMDKNAFNNLSVINKMALSLCKLVQPIHHNVGLRTIRKSFGWNHEKGLSELLSNFDEETLRITLENVKK